MDRMEPGTVGWTPAQYQAVVRAVRANPHGRRFAVTGAQSTAWSVSWVEPDGALRTLLGTVA